MTVWKQVPEGAKLIMKSQLLTPFSGAALWKMSVWRQIPEGAELIMKSQLLTPFSDAALGNWLYGGKSFGR